MIKDSFNILFVDDEKSIRDGMSQFLVHFCDKLFVAKDGKEALEIYEKNSIDILLSDIRMPRMDGIELARRIKELNEDQIIIFTTAYSDSNFFLEAIELQVDAFVLKPIDFEKLEKKILFFKDNIKEREESKRKQILLDKIVELTKNLLIVLDKDKNIILSNRAFLDFFGIKSAGEFKRKMGCIKNIITLQDNTKTFKQSSNWIDEIALYSEKNEIFLLKDSYFYIHIHKIEETEDTIFLFNDITEVEKEKINFQNRSFRDELTSIYNRAFFNEEIKKSITRYKRTGLPFSLIMFDIDHFKDVNDNYGHQTGDEVLKNLAKLIKRNIRESDTLARWGGEEFMLILHDTDLQPSKAVAEELRKKIKKEPIVDNLSITCSFGVTTLKKGDTICDITNRVDEALYEAKKSGRDMVVAKS